MIATYLSEQLNVPLKINRYTGIFKGLKGIAKLWRYTFRHTDAPVIITVQRMAIPAIVKSIFTRSKVIVVFHHYDRQEKLSLFYHANAWMLFRLLAAGLSQVKVVAVAGFWVRFLHNKGIDQSAVYLVPNLFDPGKYQTRHVLKNKKQVYFGQYGAKQHPSVFELINKLNQYGYECFFTTPFEKEAKVKPAFKVLHLSFPDYLREVGSSAYSVNISAFNEGWNRVAHESILCGTQVIGNNKGGLGDLLREANQFAVADTADAFRLISAGETKAVNPGFLPQYDISQISYYAEPIIKFCKG